MPDTLKKHNRTLIFGVQKDIFWLGVISFLTDISSEMIFSVLTIFLTVILGASSAILGFMEGLADFSASSLDYIAGYLSDKTGKRKIIALFGYAFSTLAKTILVIATSVNAIIAFRVVERLGKSIRGAPRDALISTVADKNKLGFSFGFHKMMDKTGAILGPIVAYILLSTLGQTLPTFKLLFWIALVPALLSVLILAFAIKDKPAPADQKIVERHFFSTYKLLGKTYKRYIKVAGLFSLSYFSFAFLLLKAHDVGFEIKDITLLYAIFNISFILISIPAGKLGDKFGRKKIIMAEYLIYAAMCFGFIFATSKLAVIALFLVYGIFYAIDEAQTKAYISDISPPEHRASAIGLYSFITGAIYLPASLIAGILWNMYSPAVTFGLAGAIALCAAIFFNFVPEPERTAHPIK